MKAITLSNLRKRIRYFFNLMINPSKALIIKRKNNDDKNVMLSLEEDNALTETNYLMSSEANRRRLLESIKQLENEKLIRIITES